MYEILKNLTFPHGIGQLISLLVVLFTICYLIPWLVRDIRKTNIKKAKRAAQCRKALRNSYEVNMRDESDPFGVNYRIHDIR